MTVSVLNSTDFSNKSCEVLQNFLFPSPSENRLPASFLSPCLLGDGSFYDGVREAIDVGGGSALSRITI